MKNYLSKFLFAILDFYFICYKLAYTAKPLFIILYKINGYIQVRDESNYLTFIPPDQKDDSMLKKYKKMQDKAKNLIKVKNNDSDGYGDDYSKTKVDSNEGLSLEKTLEMYNIVRLIKSVLNEKNKHYAQVLLEERLNEVLKREEKCFFLHINNEQYYSKKIY